MSNDTKSEIIKNERKKVYRWTLSILLIDIVGTIILGSGLYFQYLEGKAEIKNIESTSVSRPFQLQKVIMNLNRIEDQAIEKMLLAIITTVLLIIIYLSSRRYPLAAVCVLRALALGSTIANIVNNPSSVVKAGIYPMVLCFLLIIPLRAAFRARSLEKEVKR